MNCNLPKITYSAFRLLLLLKIHAAISPEKDVGVAKRSFKAPIIAAYSRKSNGLGEKTILRRVKNPTSVATYQSAIALQIAAQSQQNPSTIAGEIAEICRQFLPESALLDSNFGQTSLRDLTVSVTETDFIEFKFGDRAVEAWLQSWLDAAFRRSQIERVTDLLNSKSDVLSQDEILLCQYAYARCESILQLAKLISLEPLILPQFEFRLLKPSERALLFQIVSVVDDLIEATAQACRKNAIALAQAFEAFDRTCRIFGKPTITQSHVAQRRLALVMITQLLIRELLEQKLGVFLPNLL